MQLAATSIYKYRCILNQTTTTKLNEDLDCKICLIFAQTFIIVEKYFKIPAHIITDQINYMKTNILNSDQLIKYN